MGKGVFISQWRDYVMRFVLKYFFLGALLVVLLPRTGNAQARVNVEMKRGSLSEVFTAIQNQSNLRFLYSNEDIASIEVKEVHFKDAEVKDVLNFVLKNTGLVWQLRDEVVSIIKDAPKKPLVNSVRISGKVSDTGGGTLPGVSVMIKGTSLGTSTDIDGNYMLEIPDKKGTILVFSFIGMKSREVVYDGKKEINVTLDEEVEDLGEVIVTGYFNKAKSSFTGTANTYSAEDLKKVNPVNLLSALSVLDPSFRMVENNLDGSNPNVIPEFQVRGGSSIRESEELRGTFVGSQNMPTFILDGFEVTASKVFDLDPERVESMTVLKDAAATAIYGSRASNGVVVINTKQPVAGKIRVLYNLDVSFNIPDLSDYDLLNAREKLELEKASGYFDPYGTPEQTEIRERDYNYRLGLVESGYDTYWLDKPLQTAVGHKHSLSIEGGEAAMRYSLDLNYEKLPGVMKESGRERMGIGVMLLYRFKNVDFKNNMTYDYVCSDNSPYGTFRTYASLNPYYRYRDDDGNYIKNLEDESAMKRFALGRESAYNPLYNTTLNTIDESSYSEFVNNFGIDWRITDNFRLKGNIAIRHKKNEGRVFKPSDHTDFANYAESDFYRKGYYQATEGKELFYDGNVVLSYYKELDKHYLNANVVWNIQGGSGDQYSVRVEGFPDDRLDYISFAAQYAKSALPTGEDYVSRLMGIVGNIGYTYDNRYLLDASVRFDGSSKFGSESRWAPFWSVGLGWNVQKEKFMESVGWLSILKPRVSYGVTGSQSFDPYQSMIMYQYYTQDRYRDHVGAQMMGLGNPNLKWQQTNQFSVGLDFAVWNERVFVAANYYRNVSKDLLTDVSLPSSLGFTSYRENLGKVENKGYEINLRAVLMKKGNTYVNVVASGVHNVNVLKKISNSLEAWNKAQDESTENMNVPKVRYVEGESINSIWGVPSLGINPGSGKEIFVAADGTLTDVWKASDQQVLGCEDPKLEGNLGLNAGYKGIQLSCYFTYRLGGQLYNSTLVERIENVDKRNNTDRRVLEARWQKTGDITFFKDVKDNSVTRVTSRFVEDYNYLQFSSLNVSYDFPTSLTRKLHMENLRLSFSMNDVFRASSVKIERGLDYPFARAFRTSLRVIF